MRTQTETSGFAANNANDYTTEALSHIHLLQYKPIVGKARPSLCRIYKYYPLLLYRNVIIMSMYTLYVDKNKL